MNRTHDSSAVFVRQVDTNRMQSRAHAGVTRAAKVLIFMSLFSVVVLVILACSFAALLRAFAN